MPVNKEDLEAALREAVNGDGELYSLLHQKMLANDQIATAFLSGYMRNKDYTQKTQGLADERRTLEEQKRTTDGQLEQYRQLLEAAETDKAKVLKDLASHKVSVAEAHARLKHIKQVYQLSDDDIPNMPDLIDTSTTRRPVDTSTDIDTKLAQLEQRITKYVADKLIPELGGMAQLDIVWSDIRDEHRELTGKRLTAKQSQELLDEADKRSRAGKPISLKALWEEKYEVSNLRQKHHDDEIVKEHRAKWDAEQQAKLSEAALAGIIPTSPDQQGLRTSQILHHKFQVHEEAPGTAPKPRETPSAAQRQALSGAERASRKYLERRANGVPMGAPDEKKATKVA